MKNTIKYLVVVSVLIASTAFAEMDKYESEALQDTKNLLNDKAAREAVIKENPDAQKHVDQMNALGMTADQKNKAYGISSEIFSQLIKEQNGDASAVNKMLLNAQQDPEAFYDSLSPDSRAKIKALGFQLEGQKSTNPAK